MGGSIWCSRVNGLLNRATYLPITCTPSHKTIICKDIEGDYMRTGWTQTGTKSDRYNDITWDREEGREWLHEIGMKCEGSQKSFIYKVCFSMLHIGRWPFRYEPNHHGRSSTAGDILTFLLYHQLTNHRFSCFPSTILRALQTFAHARPLTQCFRGHKKLRPV